MKMGALGPVVGHHQLFDRVGLDLRDEEIHQGACACAFRPTSSIELVVLPASKSCRMVQLECGGLQSMGLDQQPGRAIPRAVVMERPWGQVHPSNAPPFHSPHHHPRVAPSPLFLSCLPSARDVM